MVLNVITEMSCSYTVYLACICSQILLLCRWWTRKHQDHEESDCFVFQHVASVYKRLSNESREFDSWWFSMCYWCSAAEGLRSFFLAVFNRSFCV